MTPQAIAKMLVLRAAELRTVVAFLTRLQVGGPDIGDAPIARSIWAFPVVGWGLGLGAGAVFAGGLAFGLGVLPAAVVAVAFEVWTTGAFHEDGLADTADGLGGATHEDALEILRDSRLGTFGVSALALFLAARIGVIAAVADPLSVIAMLAAAGAISRAALAWPMALVRPARADGMSAFIGVPTVREAAVATVIAAGLALVFLGVGLTVFALAVAAVGAGAVAVVARRSLGGQTGDVLGARQQVAYVLILLMLSARL